MINCTVPNNYEDAIKERDAIGRKANIAFFSYIATFFVDILLTVTFFTATMPPLWLSLMFVLIQTSLLVAFIYYGFKYIKYHSIISTFTFVHDTIVSKIVST